MRSLKSKWGMIKHHIVEFIGAYNQIKRMYKVVLKKLHIIPMAKYLYRTKPLRTTKFMFEHCWEWVKDFPQWANGISTSRKTTRSRTGSQVSTTGSKSVVETASDATTSIAFTFRPDGTKAAKKVHMHTRSKIKQLLCKPRRPR